MHGYFNPTMIGYFYATLGGRFRPTLTAYFYGNHKQKKSRILDTSRLSSEYKNKKNCLRTDYNTDM